MTVKQLSTGNYGKVVRAIDEMTIEMYQDITKGLLHDNSPIQLATDIYDIWEVVAQSLYDNTEITHRQFLKAIMRIDSLIETAQKSLGVEVTVL